MKIVQVLIAQVLDIIQGIQLLHQFSKVLMEIIDIQCMKMVIIEQGSILQIMEQEVLVIVFLMGDIMVVIMVDMVIEIGDIIGRFFLGFGGRIKLINYLLNSGY